MEHRHELDIISTGLFQSQAQQLGSIRLLAWTLIITNFSLSSSIFLSVAKRGLRADLQVNSHLNKIQSTFMWLFKYDYVVHSQTHQNISVGTEDSLPLHAPHQDLWIKTIAGFILNDDNKVYMTKNVHKNRIRFHRWAHFSQLTKWCNKYKPWNLSFILWFLNTSCNLLCFCEIQTFGKSKPFNIIVEA